MAEDTGIEQEVDTNEDGLDDLIDWPTEEPATETESTETPGEDTAEPEGGEEPRPEPPAADEPAKPEGEEQDPVDGDGKKETPKQTYKYRGREISIDELMADEKLRSDLFTAANQQVHYQELHGENKGKISELENQLNQLIGAEQERQRQYAMQQQVTQGPEGPKPEQIESAYKAEITELAKTGWISEDMAELYPKEVSNFLLLRDSMNARIAQLEQVVGSIGNTVTHVDQYTQQTRAETARETVERQLNNVFDTIAAEGGIFEPLGTQETREQFLSNIVKVYNPNVKELLDNPENLKQLWIGQNHTALIAAAAKAKEENAAKQVQNRRLAAGEGMGSGPANTAPSVIPGEAEGWADL